MPVVGVVARCSRRRRIRSRSLPMTTFRRLRCLDPRSRRSLSSLPSLPSLARSVRRILSRTKTHSNKRVFCLCYCQLFLFTPSSSHPTRMKRSTQLIFLWFLVTVCGNMHVPYYEYESVVWKRSSEEVYLSNVYLE